MLPSIIRNAIPWTVRNSLRNGQVPWKRPLWDIFRNWLLPEQRRAQLEKNLDIPNSTWVFISGMNNSGTTLLDRMLGRSRLFRALPKEGQYFTQALPLQNEALVPRLFTLQMDKYRLTEETQGYDAKQVMLDWAEIYPPPPGFLLEKSPPNVVRTRWLQRHFQPCAFVALVRDPYAVCEGIRRRHVGRWGFQMPMEYTVAHWVLCNQTLLEDLPYLKKAVLMRYEDLVARPAEELDRVRLLLDLPEPFDPGIYQGEFAVHNSTGNAAAVRNFNEDSYKRLSPGDFEVISRVAGPLMERLGYPVRKAG